MKFTSSTAETVATYLHTIVPWAHGHQLKGLTDFVIAILARQTGNQAELVRGMGNQEAAAKRLSRLTHNARLPPHPLADAVLDYAVRHLPCRGQVRLALDWTIEGDQYLLVLSLVFKGRAVPIFWRAYAASVLKGRMKQFELALVKRALTRIRRVIKLRRLIVTADRAFAEEALGALLDEFGVEYVIRAKASTKVLWHGVWQQLQTIPFTTNARRRNLGRIPYCQSGPRTLWVSLSRVKNEAGVWGSLVSHFQSLAAGGAHGRRICPPLWVRARVSR